MEKKSRSREFLGTSIIVGCLTVMLAGCVGGQGAVFGGPGPLEINRSDIRFSVEGEQVILSQNNRISRKSIVGGQHLDGFGVFLNPGAIIDTRTEKLIELTLVLQNMARSDTSLGAGNRLGVPREIIFNTGDEAPISLSFLGGDVVWADRARYDSVLRSVERNVMESGIVVLTLAEYRRIMNSDQLAIQIHGSRNSVIYEASDLESSFQPNLELFYQYIVGPD